MILFLHELIKYKARTHQCMDQRYWEYQVESYIIPSLVISEVNREASRARHLLSAQRRANDITVCINLGLTCIADAHCSQIHSGSHPFITFPPIINERLTSPADWYSCYDSQSPGDPPVDFCASPFMKYHDIHNTFPTR